MKGLSVIKFYYISNTVFPYEKRDHAPHLNKIKPFRMCEVTLNKLSYNIVMTVKLTRKFDNIIIILYFNGTQNMYTIYYINIYIYVIATVYTAKE